MSGSRGQAQLAGGRPVDGGLGTGEFGKGDEIPIRIEDREFFGAPRLGFERCLWVDDSECGALKE
jgi:hypothetical protein